jgi:drug/metabolite transporter (DMT)-like permease
MSTPITQLQPAASVHRSFRLSSSGILLLGVIAIPFALTVALNSYGPLTEDSAIRMAFATVAGQTIAVLSSIVVIGIALFRRARIADIAVLVIIGAVVTLSAMAAMTGASELLLNNLDLVAETNLPSR